jgi:hypothetical protein
MSNDLGQELDLFLAYKQKNWRTNLAIGRFKPGNAYNNSDYSSGWTAEFRYYL